MLTIHHLENSRSQRILWLLEELGVDYDIKRYPRDPTTKLAPAALKAVHPLGKSPVLTDGDKVIAESGAIVEYLLANYGDQKLLPEPGTDEHHRYQYWLHYAEGTFMPLMIISLIFNSVETKAPFFVRPIARAIANQVKASYLEPNISRNLAFMEQSLTDHEWFAGARLSGADILMSFPVEAASVRADLATYPKLEQFLTRVRSRPAWQAAIDKGGPYDLLSRV